MTQIPPDRLAGTGLAATLDLNLLRVLDALLSAGSVSAAARRLDLSQPAISAALARLRTALQDPLLVRSGNRMRPTALARELAPRVVHILADIGDALNVAARFAPASTQRRFRIAANDYASMLLLAPFAGRFRSLAPRATLEILPLGEAPHEALADRQIDLAIADGWSLRAASRRSRLFHEDFVGVARADHPRLGEQVSLADFLAEDHALVSMRGLSPGVLDRRLASRGMTRRVALTLPHFLAAPAVVAHSDLVMLLPWRVAAAFAKSHALRLFDAPLPLKGFDVVMAYDPRAESDPPLKWLRKELADCATQVAGAVRADDQHRAMG